MPIQSSSPIELRVGDRIVAPCGAEWPVIRLYRPDFRNAERCVSVLDPFEGTEHDLFLSTERPVKVRRAS